jgi:hypothetical protein
MAIVATDIDFHLSGGSGNTNVNASLGGAISTTQIGAPVHNLFDQVSGAESSAGDTEYRCMYVKNSHGSLTLQGAKVWITSNTPSTGTAVRIALGTSAVNGTEQTIVNESTAPSGVTWSTAVDEANALSIGDIPFGQHKAIWIERVISAGAGAYNDDQATIRCKGDTAA